MTQSIEATQGKAHFLSKAGHDLRQPLQALGMFTTILSSRDLPDEIKSLVSRLEDCVHALDDMLGKVFEVAKLDAGIVQVRHSEASVKPVFDRLTEEFTPRADAYGLRLEVISSDRQIKTDPVLLERILRCLLENAIQYSDTGVIRLECRIDGQAMVIDVKDQGIGIAPTEMQAIFDDFHQVGKAISGRPQGNGLGLAIVRRLVDLLQHKVKVSSIPSQGSVFSLEVPLA